MQLYPGAPTETRPNLLSKLAIKPWVKAPPEDLILTNAQIVQPSTSSILAGKQKITIKNGMIASVKSDALHTGEEGVKTVDLNGAFVCPGLIDCHVHITAVPGVKNMGEYNQLLEQDINLRTAYVLKEMLLRGFTTVRDTGGASKRIALAIEEGLMPGPRLIQCGKALSQTGGHGDSSPAVSGGVSTGCCGGHSSGLSRVADGVPEVLKAVREELKAGADFIKIMVGGGVASETDAIETVQYTAEEIRAITTTCKQMGGKISTAHAYTVDAIRHAIDNGVAGIEHGNLIDKPTANLQNGEQRDIFDTHSLVLRLVSVQFPYGLPEIDQREPEGIMVRPPFEDFLPPDGKIKNAQVMAQGLEALRIAHDAGVHICYGSDLLTSMHALQTEEFAVRASVLPSSAILKHATTNAAHMLGKSSLIGTIAAGAYADLLILNKNPLEDVTVLDRPEDHLLAVMKQGRVFSSIVQGLEVES
ncbi:Amidohydro-rel domain-containing protein [Mycena sanguinolenta]|uniref:Amidohydro-rel domain-containing protein n=1 Tax=Mycena sanguinolenta TaxID=230812 RepID=A0A8H7DA01_9AGAR|nr:Amidohydro-rel domain-containing protein [Mycena sanguinolenta]